MHEVLVNRLGGLSLHRNSVVRLTEHPDMTIALYRGHNKMIQQQHATMFSKDRDIRKRLIFLFCVKNMWNKSSAEWGNICPLGFLI